MKLHSIFADGGGANPVKSIETARRKLRAARDVGVYPTYTLCGRDLIRALGNIRTEVYNELARGKFLEPEVTSNPAYDVQNCSSLVNQALTKVQTVLMTSAKLVDR